MYFIDRDPMLNEVKGEKDVFHLHIDAFDPSISPHNVEYFIDVTAEGVQQDFGLIDEDKDVYRPLTLPPSPPSREVMLSDVTFMNEMSATKKTPRRSQRLIKKKICCGVCNNFSQNLKLKTKCRRKVIQKRKTCMFCKDVESTVSVFQEIFLKISIFLA